MTELTKERAGKMKEPKVVAIILCHNSKQWLNRCIESLIETEYNNLDIVLVDNASTDHSLEKYKNDNRITILQNNKNLGWCKANNVGIEYAKKIASDYIYISNSDVVFFDKNWLKNLIEFSKDNSMFSIVGPIQYAYDDENKYNDWTNYIFELGNRDVHYMWSEKMNNKNRKTDYFNDGSSCLEVPFVQGSGMLVKKSLFDLIGHFDDLYFIYYDELDFCRRNLRIGGRIGLVTNSRIMHYGSGDTKNTVDRNNKKNYLMLRNKYIFLLSDYNLNYKIKNEILFKWIKNDLKESLGNNLEYPDVLVCIKALINVFFLLPQIHLKKKKEKNLDKKIITDLLIQNKTVDDFVQTHFGIFDCKADASKRIQYLVKYILKYDWWKRF